MQLAILITGILASLLFFLSGISYFFKWGNFKNIAVAFLAAAITLFILMIIRHVKEEWKIGSYNKKGE
jgi:hypothetical protein